MVDLVSVVGIAGLAATTGMVVVILYFVRLGMEQDAHAPSLDEDEQPELGDGETDAEETSRDVADGSSA